MDCYWFENSEVSNSHMLSTEQNYTNLFPFLTFENIISEFIFFVWRISTSVQRNLVKFLMSNQTALASVLGIIDRTKFYSVNFFTPPMHTNWTHKYIVESLKAIET